ncbi:hypothetical protein [Neisseria chenwenguii]|uniref:Uncharacterized protein n=1 Tax=Neisseria chenwenguii TaxID=1853278 RepID=A0A220S3Q7_9NEIS|nr:hypothetical protein [Neisseria chenwenguii]ASK28038.1 hypothetical protein BG910_10125 [Neisseria chenwenguii]ROV57189.1 hypothetical protein EGS38_00385 [Neisseria chenwenguii]
MKLSTLLIIGSAALLSACQSSQPSLSDKGAQELGNIRHLCILTRTKDPNPGLNEKIAHALQQHGISSETVEVPANRQRLYEPECRYNLRYNSQGRGDKLNYISLLIRTPEYPVASLRAHPNFKTADQQAEVDQIVSRLLNKK